MIIKFLCGLVVVCSAVKQASKDQVSTVLIPETNINANDTKINGVNMKRNIFPVLAF